MGSLERDTVVLRTIHGSHLYGLAHEGSDMDTYTVVWGDKRGRQRVDQEAGTDDVVIGFPLFLQRVWDGSHQSVEALFSQEAEVHPAIQPFVSGYRVTNPDAMRAYQRTITKFAYSDTYKQRRHAIRLAYNLADLRESGRFDPRLSRLQAVRATGAAVDWETTWAVIEDICGLTFSEDGLRK